MMVEHLDTRGGGPRRAVVIGAGGFIGNAIAGALDQRGVATTRLGRAQVDLMAPRASEQLASHLNADDAVVVVSAKAPCKTNAMFLDNIAMMKAVLDALGEVPPSHVLYVSSDAVYSDSPSPLSEASVTAPDNLHGVMHVARETMLRAGLPQTPLAFLRPTLVYGAADPHNGYGPNRFRRLAQAGEPIVLFGEGEERRDHVAVEDVADLAARMVMHRSAGVLNAATGHVISFMDIAKLVAGLSDSEVEIRTTERQGPMPHNGYRPFDPAGVMRAFADFSFSMPEHGIKQMYNATKA